MKKYISPLNEKFDYKAYFDKFYEKTKDPQSQFYFSIFEQKGLRFLMNSCYMFHLTLNTLSEMKNDEEITAFWIYEKYTQKQWEKTAQNLSQNLKNKFFTFIENSGIKLARILHQNNTTKITLSPDGDQKCKRTREFFVRHNYDCYLPCHENPILSIIIRGLELIVEIWDNIPKEKIRIGFPHDMMKNYFLAKGILKDMTINQYEGEEEWKTHLNKSKLESCQNFILPSLDRRESINIERYFEEPNNEEDQQILEQKLLTEDEVLIRFLADMVPNNIAFKNYLLALINKSRKNKNDAIKIASSNAITILVAANVSFANCDFKSVKICGANVRDGNFNSCDFTDADSSNTNLENCQFNNAKMMRTNLQGIKLGIYPDIDLNVTRTLRCCCFSPNGKLIAVSTMDGEIMIWEKTSGVKLYSLQKNELPINSIVFSNEGTQILVGGNDTNVRIWRLSDGRIVKTFNGHTDCVKTVAFSNQGFFVASGSVDKTMRIWDRSSGKMIQKININSIVNSVAFSPNMNFLASGASDYGVYLFGYKQKTWIHYKTIFGHKESITKVVFAPDSQSVFSCSYDQLIKQWDCDNATTLALKTFDSNSGPVFSITISISKDGNHMLSVANNKIHLWDTKNGKILKTFIGQDWNIRSVFFSPDGDSILSCTENKIKIWDKSEFLHFKLHEGHQGSILSISFSPDGVALASGGVDNSVKLWNKTTGKLLKKFIGHKDQVNFVKVSNNVVNGYIASGSYDKTIKIWDIKSEKCLSSMEKHMGSVDCLDISPDDSLVVSGSLDKTVKLWRSFDGSLLKSFDVLSEVKSVCFSKDGELIFCGLVDSKIKILHKDSLNLLIDTLTGHSNFVNSIACSTQSDIIASGSSDRTVIVWNYKNGSKLNLFKHDAIVNSVAFSPGKKNILSGTSDGNIHLWDIESEKELSTYEAHNGNVNAVVFANDGRCFASCSKEIKIWEDSDCFVFKKIESNDSDDSEEFKKKKTSGDFPLNLYELSKSSQEHGRKGCPSKLYMSIQRSNSLEDLNEFFICNLIINSYETPLSCKDLTIAEPQHFDSKNEQVLIQRGALGLVNKNKSE